MKRGEWHEAARLLHANSPDLSHREIGELLGVTASAVTKVLNPEGARRWVRNADAKPGRNAQKRASEDAARAECCDCGRRCGPGTKWKGTKRCVDCWRLHQKASNLLRDRQIEAMWNEGLTMREIAERVGFTFDHIKVEIHRLRYDGRYSIPFRRNSQALANIRAGNARRWEREAA